MLKKFHITCNEATTICDKSQYNEASFFEIIKLRFHLLFCNYCGLYSKQNNTISLLCKKKASDSKHKTYCISSEDKALLKKQLQELNN